VFSATGSGMSMWFIKELRPAILRGVTVRQTRTAKHPTNNEAVTFSENSKYEYLVVKRTCLHGLNHDPVR